MAVKMTKSNLEKQNKVEYTDTMSLLEDFEEGKVDLRNKDSKESIKKFQSS